MYQLKCTGYDVHGVPFNNETLHDSRSEVLRLVEANCDMELNKTGTLKLRIPPTHSLFDRINQHSTEISLYQDGSWVYTGRILNDETDIYGFKMVECEGILGYLLDSIQRAEEHHITGDKKIERYLTKVLEYHNTQMRQSNKWFTTGDILIDDESETFYKVSSYKTTLATINEDLIDTFNGYFFARRIISDGSFTNKLDYIPTDKLPINRQVIRFGENLLKLTKYVKGEEIATAIIPLGKSIESTDESVIKQNHNITELGAFTDGTIVHEAGADYIYDSEMVAKYGYIFKVVTYSDVETAETLLNNAKKELNQYKTSSLTLELSVFDLHLLDVSIDSIRVGQKIRVISPPHGLDIWMVVSKISLNITSPDKSTITLVTEDKVTVKTTGGGISSKANSNNADLSNIQKDIFDSGYIKSEDFGVGGAYDLSQYATIVAVNSAFDELAMLLGGI